MNAQAMAARQDFDTRLFLPQWWVKAFGFVTSRMPLTTDALQQVWHTQVCPILGDTELNAFAMILSSFQSQILHSDSDILRVAPNEYQKHASSANKSRLHTFSRTLQTLPGFRFMMQHGDEYLPIPLLKDERWPQNERDKRLFDLECKATDLGVDLILGYTLSHLELARKANKQHGAEILLGENAPLSMWRSVWQELSVTEQAFLLRLEQAMQWECRWLHFDGIFGKNLFELLYDLDIRGNSGRTSDMGQLNRVRVFLDRLGKKLGHQGLLKFDVDEEYLALSNKEDYGAMLLWQASSARVQSVEAEVYKQKCVSHLLLNTLTPRISEVFDLVFANHSHRSWLKPEIEQAYMQLVAKDFDPVYQVAFDVNASCPVMALPLFFEWCIRGLPDHRFPLSEELADSDLGRLCHSDFGDGLEERYRKFCYLLSENSEYRRGCVQDQLSSLSLSRAYGNNDFRRYMATYNTDKNKDKSEPTRIDLPKPMELPGEASSFAQSRNSIDHDQSLSPGMRKIAAQELQKIQDTDPAMYNTLKNNYINSLESGRKKLVLDMQQRMKQEQFENHLKHSLIKFMINNPGMWKSAKPAPERPRNSFTPVMTGVRQANRQF